MIWRKARSSRACRTGCGKERMGHGAQLRGPFLSALSERNHRPEDVVVAGRGLVPLHEALVDIHGPRVVDTTTNALAAATAFGLVGDDDRVAERGGRHLVLSAEPVEEAAAKTVAAAAPLGLVVEQQAVGDGQGE